MDDKYAYAVQAYPIRKSHSPMFELQDTGYLLIADSNENEPMLDSRSWSRDKGLGFIRKAKQEPKWHRWIHIRMRSMVKAGNNLFVAGPPDTISENEPYASLDGKKGAILKVLSAKDGKDLAEYKLDVPPVFDGMISANGKLYISLKDCSIICFAE